MRMTPIIAKYTIMGRLYTTILARSVISIHLTSSKPLVGIAGVISKIQKEKKVRDVYILGSANVGKSAFVNALLSKLLWHLCC
uniref:Nitric oxide synthase n=1 Tax=Elaeis guineensis var. tenera TaxID=51953 RepID=A0A6J0PE57_ELAGV|nr:putative nitric oxide synthase [Elaeis guineensis]